jgi:hypothetical protein
LIDAAWRLGAAVLVLIVGGVALRLLTGPLRRALGRSRFDPAAASFLVNTARAALVRRTPPGANAVTAPLPVFGAPFA